jgi:hypothetical protein
MTNLTYKVGADEESVEESVEGRVWKNVNVTLSDRGGNCTALVRKEERTLEADPRTMASNSAYKPANY